jgi:hypothetical protein
MLVKTHSSNTDGTSIIVILTVCSIVSVVFLPLHTYYNSSLIARQHNERIHDVNDVFSQIRLPSSILPSFISCYRYI